MEKLCISCRETKDVSEFYPSKIHTDGLFPYCRMCNIIKTRLYYKEKYKQKAYEKNITSRDKLRLLVESYKTKCSKCGEERKYCLDFHHRDGEEKESAIAQIPYRHFSIERAKKEIEKCDIVCSNCHRELHHNERNGVI